MSNPIDSFVKCYRCGYCGQPTCERGFVLSLEYINNMNVDWDKAELTHGECCAAQQEHENQRQIVTRDMAIDAGDPSLEGQYI